LRKGEKASKSTKRIPEGILTKGKKKKIGSAGGIFLKGEASRWYQKNRGRLAGDGWPKPFLMGGGNTGIKRKNEKKSGKGKNYLKRKRCRKKSLSGEHSMGK